MKDYSCKPGAVVVQFKFENTSPLVYGFRRVMHYQANPTTGQFWTTGYSLMNTFPVGAFDNIVTQSWFGNADVFAQQAQKFFQQAHDTQSYAIAELWIWTSEGWCLRDTVRNW